MSNDLRVSDLVRLKSGGPVMTVMNAQGAAGEIWCVWTIGNRQHRDAFPANSLEKCAPITSG